MALRQPLPWLRLLCPRRVPVSDEAKTRTTRDESELNGLSRAFLTGKATKCHHVSPLRR